MLLDYGQPVNGIVQFAYIVEDVAQAMLAYGRAYGIGPWFVTQPFSPAAALYRGEPAGLTIQLARTFSGSMMVELIQQHGTEPSVYREIVDRRGYGFHHCAIMTDRFDADVARYGADGFALAYSDVLEGGRIAYFDTSHVLDGMTELIELTPRAEARHAFIHRASLGWDGRDPVRAWPPAPTG